MVIKEDARGSQMIHAMLVNNITMQNFFLLSKVNMGFVIISTSLRKLKKYERIKNAIQNLK